MKVALFVYLLLSATICMAGPNIKPVAEVPFQLDNNLVLLQTRVNGSGPLPFILDTGASTSVINARLTEKLGLKAEGQGEATTGGGAIDVRFVNGAKLRVGSVDLPNATLTAIPLAGLESGLGQAVGGIIGYEMFERYVVEIDYVSRIVRLYEPKNYQYTGKGSAIPTTLVEKTPFVHARIIGPAGVDADGTFEFDTGQVGSLTVTGDFVSRNNLLDPSRKILEMRTGAILAGRVNARVVRVKGVRLGAFVVSEPVATIIPGFMEAGIEEEAAGLIGGEILRRFTVVIDYARSRVILEPNRQFSAPIEFDMSGMSLAAQDSDLKTYAVRTLIEGGPAAESGIKIGDVITAIDGKPVDKMTLSQIRQLFRIENKQYELSIKRGGVSSIFKLKTRKLV